MRDGRWEKRWNFYALDTHWGIIGIGEYESIVFARP
jgi:hypothetical protein